MTTWARHGLAPVLEVHSIGFLRWGPSGPARPVIAPAQKDRHSWAVAVHFAFVPWRLGRTSGHFYGTRRFAMMQNVKCSLTRDHRCGPALGAASGAKRVLRSACSDTRKEASTRSPLRWLIHALLAPLWLVGGADAATAVLDRDIGSFVGSGTILERPNANSHRVRCRFTAGYHGSSSPRHVPGSSDPIEIHQRRSTPRPGSFHRREIAGSRPIRSASQYAA